VEYVPPSDDRIDRLVENASQRLAVCYEDEGYLDPEVAYGLSAFIKLVARIKAKQLNRLEDDHFDRPHELG